MKANEATPASGPWRARQVAARLTAYGLLLGASLAFSFPFLWMVGTSFKVDRELFSEKIRLLPQRPRPAARSPYLDDRHYAAPAGPAAARIVPLIREALDDLPPPVAPGDAAPAAVRAIVEAGLWERLGQVLPAGYETLPEQALRQAVRARVTAPLAAETLRRATREFALGAVRARGHDLQEVDLTAGLDLSALWRAEGAAVRQLAPTTAPGERAAVVHYDFGRDGSDRFTLSADLAVPFDVSRLHRLQVFFKPDDSWHRVTLEVESGGRLLRASRPEILGTFAWTGVTLQEYGPDDRSTKIRFWNPLREVARGTQVEGRPGHLRLRLVVTRSSPLGAWRAKCGRAYTAALTFIPFWRYAATSVLLVLLNLAGTLLGSSLVAYGFSRLRWPGRDIVFGIMLATMMIPSQVTMIPHFLIIRQIGWYNTLNPLWAASLFGNAFNIFLLRQFMKGIPRDLEDAARIDGCNALQVYWHVMVPLVKPTLACIGIFTFMGVWNDFMGPLIYLTDQRLYPLSLGLYALNVQAGQNFSMMMAGSLLMTLPVIIIFFFAQKYFIQGISLTGMKG